MFDSAVAIEAPSRPSDRRRAETRREILEAAWALSREHGLAKWSLRELADRIGMRAPSLYSYFPSRDAIVDAMFAEGQRQMAEHMAVLSDDVVGREGFRAAARMFFEFCTSDPTRYQLMFQRTLPGFTPSPESYALAVANFDEMTRRCASAGVDQPGQIDLWTALLTGLTDQQLSNDPGGNRWSRLLDGAVDMYCDHVGVPATPVSASPAPATPTRRRR